MSIATLSIRQKLVIGVALILVFMTAGILATYYWMRSLHEKIRNLETISRLEESVLEMRRFEKNFFLYGDPQFLKSVQYNAARVQTIFQEQHDLFERLSSIDSANTFGNDVQRYQELVTRCHEKAMRDGQECSVGESKNDNLIREVGARIADFAEWLASQKRKSINETIENTIRLQMAGFALAGIGIAVMGGLMFIKITAPLRLLEESTRKVAKGEFEPIEIPPQEKEVRDIFSSFNKMARELKQRQEQLVQSRKLASLGTMLAGVAHEINNPLSNISSSCEILLEELDESDKEFQSRTLSKVLEQVDKARNIVRTLLEFSRNRDFCKERLNLKELVDKTFILLHGQIPPSVRIVEQVNENITIEADRQRMQQALINLVSNAVQSIEGDGTVEIAATNSTDGMVEIVVRDSGQGIPAEHLSRIFDPFFTTKDVGRGTGLGLFVTHDIIASHNGSITVDSGPGKGTTFTVSIPAQGDQQC